MPLNVTVFGAGAFGGWTALHLLRSGAKVTLVDAWGPGNSRASSGDESRVIRGSYGPNNIYTELVARALPMWRGNQQRWRIKLFHQTGAMWIAGGSDAYEKSSVANLKAAGLPFDVLDHSQCRRRFPQVDWTGLDWAIYEKEAGYLLARRACQAVMEGFVAEGGVYRQGLADPARLSDWNSDHFVFACGPWLAKLFPDLLRGILTPTRQEIFYFGTPASDTRFDEGAFPTWVDNSPVRFYGIPGNQWRGFKVAEDTPGPPSDPTNGDRTVTPEGIANARRYLARRFPGMKDAPLVESRVCQYEMSADGGLIADHLPGNDRVWIAGGGSGHGFKFSPALGEHLANLVLGKDTVKDAFALKRFDTNKGKVGERK